MAIFQDMWLTHTKTSMSRFAAVAWLCSRVALHTEPSGSTSSTGTVLCCNPQGGRLSIEALPRQVPGWGMSVSAAMVRSYSIDFPSGNWPVWIGGLCHGS